MKTSDSPNDCPNPARRQFLQLAALAGGVALIGGCAGSSNSPSTGSTYDPIKAVERPDHTALIPGGGNLTAGNALAFVLPNSNPGILYAEANGQLKAISALCTHQGCTVEWRGADKTLLCPCHGSQFDKNGKVEHGPAKLPLPTYPARKQGNDAVVSL